MKFLLYDRDFEFTNELKIKIDRYMQKTNIVYNITVCNGIQDVSILNNYDILFIYVDTLRIFEMIQIKLNHEMIFYAEDSVYMELGADYHNRIGRCMLKSSILKSVEYLLNEIFHNASSKKIVFNYKGNMYKYNISDVYVVAFKGNYVYITIENKTFKIRSDLQKYHFEKKLLNFLFVDHGTIINGDKVQHINTQDQFIILDNEKRIECSKQGVKNIKKYIYSNYNDKYK